MRLNLTVFASFALAAFMPLRGLAQAAAAPPAVTQTPAPLSAHDVVTIDWMYTCLSAGVWLTAVLALVIGTVVYFLSRGKSTNDAPVVDKNLDTTHITYGFWLIVAGLFLTLAVVTLTVNLFRPQVVGTADILAIVSSVTGIVATLTAAFFGIQAAGAGRSQALSALANLQAGAQIKTNYTLDPAFGPHAGNTRVSINGNGFSGASAVNFGTTPGNNFEFVNDGLVRCTVPPTDPKGQSAADVVVIFPSAAAHNVRVGTFYYYTLQPAQGTVAGGTLVTIIGAGLNGAVGVTFGTVAVPNPTFDAATGNLTVNSPASTAIGTVDVSVTFPVETPTKTTVIGRFEYTDH